MKKKICISKRFTSFIIGGAFIVLLFVVLSRFVLSFKPTLQSRAASGPNENPQIVIGGTPVANSDKWPFMVRLLKSTYNLGPLEDGKCSGTLIAAKWVLTAGHCLMEGDPEKKMDIQSLGVYVGSHSLASGGIIYRAKNIYLHELFGISGDHHVNDIALIELSQNVKNPQTISIATGKDNLIEGRPSIITGWGATKSESMEKETILRQAVVPVISLERANKRTWYNKRILASELPAGYPRGGIDTCYGDSGGPLVVWDGTRWIQQGIASWGDECGKPQFPGIYTLVSYNGTINGNKINYLEWIRSIIKTASGKEYNEEGNFIGVKLNDKELADYILKIYVSKEFEWDDVANK